MPTTEETTWTDSVSDQAEQTGTIEGRVIVERSVAGQNVIRRISAPTHVALALPRCLEKRGDGAIVVRGHRITLFAILEVLLSRSQVSVLSLSEAFPTIPRDVLWDILRFYNTRTNAIRAYYDEQQDVATNNERLHPYRGPSMNELRRRQQLPKRP